MPETEGTQIARVEAPFNRWLKLDNAWLRASSVEAVTDVAGGGSEVHMEGGSTYHSPYSATETLSLLDERTDGEDPSGN